MSTGKCKRQLVGPWGEIRWQGQPRGLVTRTGAAVYQPASQTPLPASPVSFLWQKDWGRRRLKQSWYKPFLKHGVFCGPFRTPLEGPPVIQSEGKPVSHLDL